MFPHKLLDDADPARLLVAFGLILVINGVLPAVVLKFICQPFQPLGLNIQEKSSSLLVGAPDDGGAEMWQADAERIPILQAERFVGLQDLDQRSRHVALCLAHTRERGHSSVGLSAAASSLPSDPRRRDRAGGEAEASERTVWASARVRPS